MSFGRLPGSGDSYLGLLEVRNMDLEVVVFKHITWEVRLMKEILNFSSFCQTRYLSIPY